MLNFNLKGQSATELAIFGSILIFVISLIFHQGLSGTNFMGSQLQAMRFAMSKSLESSAAVRNSRNTGSAYVVEDRLGGDLAGKFGSRDRSVQTSSSNVAFSAQQFQPLDNGDYGDNSMLPHYDIWVNGQRFGLTTMAYRTVAIPTTQGNLALCGDAHPTDSRCWRAQCVAGAGNQWQGCVVMHSIVQNYPGSEYKSQSDFTGQAADISFDVNFTNSHPADVPHDLRRKVSDTGRMEFMWQWQEVPATAAFNLNDDVDVDGDFKEETILQAVARDDLGRVTSVRVLDKQSGDVDFSVDGRTPDMKILFQDKSQIFSFTRNGTQYLIKEGRLFDGNTGQFIRNSNMNDHVDMVQRTLQLSNDTGRFCNGNTPRTTTDVPPWDDTGPNPVEACNNCFTGLHAQQTCFDSGTKRIYVRSRVLNKNGRSWFTRTEPGS